MGFKRGNTDIDKVYRGADEVTKIYRGGDIVYEVGGVESTNIIVCVEGIAGGDIFVSRDYGDSWTTVINPSTVSIPYACWISDNGQIILITTNTVGGRAILSIDRGVSFREIDEFDTTQPTAGRVSFNGTIILYPNRGAVVSPKISFNGGTDWSDISSAGNKSTYTNIWCSDDGQTIYLNAISSNGFYYTTNGGANWTQNNAPRPIHIVSDASNNYVYITKSGTREYSLNNGALFQDFLTASGFTQGYPCLANDRSVGFEFSPYADITIEKYTNDLQDKETIAIGSGNNSVAANGRMCSADGQYIAYPILGQRLVYSDNALTGFTIKSIPVSNEISACAIADWGE